ncbi:retrotransposon protein, putative, unclassified [Tanacetum coccineum]
MSTLRKEIDEYLLISNEVPIKWNKAILIKVHIHSWRLFLDHLPTRCNLDGRKIDIHSKMSGNETWIFESEGGAGGRGVKEKQHGLSTISGTDTGSVNESGYGGNGDDNVGDHSSGNGGTLKTTANVAATATVLPTDLICPRLLQSIRAISERFANTAYGFFLGKRVAFPVVANYVRNTWSKYGLVKSMLNSFTGLFSFHFSSMDGLDAMLENSLWFIRNNPLILKKWHPDMNLLKKDIGNVLVWIKLHGVPMATFSEDGLSGRSSYARAMIELRVDVKLKDTIVMAMPKIAGESFCVGEAKNLKKPSQTPRDVTVGPKVGFKPAKQVYQPVFPTAKTSGNKKKNVEPTEEANSSESSFCNASSSSPSTTPIVEKIDKIKRLIIDGKVTFVDDEEKPLEKVDSSRDYGSEDEVALVDNEMASFFANKDGYGTNSLLEQWKETYKNADYDYDPYDDAMYEGQEVPEKFQSICDNLDMKVRSRKKK